MRFPACLRPGAAALLAMLALGGCGEAGDRQIAIVFAADADPGDARSALADHVALATDIGLVSFDSAALVGPGLAERWVISDDGKSYIFRLGDHRWANGEPVTAAEVARLLSRRIRALGDKSLGRNLAVIDKVIARTEEVVEIELSAPNPRLLDILAGPALALAVEGEDLGPMQGVADGQGGLRLWLRDGAEERRQGHPLLAEAIPPANAVAAYEAGIANMVLDLDYDDVPLITAAGIANDEVVKDAALGHFGLQVASIDGPLTSRAVREAIAMGIDRPRLLSAFGIADWREMTSLSPPQLTNRAAVSPRDWEALDIAERKARASGLVTDSGLRGETVRLWTGADGPGSRLLFQLLRRDFDEIGLDLALAARPGEADLKLVDRVADFDDPLWYLTRLSCADGPVCDEEGDLLVDTARGLTSLSLRRDMLAQAEEMIAARYGFIPIASPLRVSLVRGPIAGFQPNYRALHPLQYIAAESGR